MKTYKIVAILSVMILPISRSTGAFSKYYPPGSIVHFKTVTAPEDVEFARKYLGRYFEGEEPAAWDRAIRDGEIKIARADLDEDGVPEVFIMVENSIWCGSRGCDGLLLQNRRGQWALMASPKISEEATIIMPEKKFGYHKLYTGDDIYTFRNGKTYEILSLEDGRIIR